MNNHSQPTYQSWHFKAHWFDKLEFLRFWIPRVGKLAANQKWISK